MPTVFSYVLGKPAVQQTIETYELPSEEVTSTILNDTPTEPSAPAGDTPAE